MSLLAIPLMKYYQMFPGKPKERSLGLVDRLQLAPLIQSGNWKEVENIIMDLPSSELSRVMDGICMSGVFDPQLESYAQTLNTDFHNMIVGYYYIYCAWESRSGRRAEFVGEDQWEGFYKYLNLANHFLNEEYMDEKMQLQAWSDLITVQMGFSEREMADETFEKCMAIDPNSVNAHMTYFSVITPKWLGSRDEMKEHVKSDRWSKEISTVLQLKYYVELYKEYYFNEIDDEDVAKRRFKADYGKECVTLLQNISIPTEENLLSLTSKNHLCYLYIILNNNKGRNRLMKELKGKYQAQPWGYFGVMCERDAKLFKWAGVL